MSWWLLAAVAASIVSAQVLGMLWYGPIFGKVWAKARGWDELNKDETDAMQKEAIPGYIASAVMAAVATAVLWIPLVSWDILNLVLDDLSPAGAGALFGLLVWVIGYVPGTFVGRFFEDTDWKVWAIGAGYWGILIVLWGTYVGVFSTL